MEKRLKKNDSENNYKYYILQIGRKYTYVGFSGLHKPTCVFTTPNFFLYNENFHNSIDDDKKIYDIIKSVSKKEKVQDVSNGEISSLRDCAEGYAGGSKREMNLPEDSSIRNRKDNEGNMEQSDNFSSLGNRGNNSNTKCNKNETNLIYHYEYKFNQDVNLWNKFFEEFIFHIFDNLAKTNNKAKKVIVVLNMFIPTIIKYALCKSLIENHEYASISYVNDLISPLFLCNCNTCVVIDLGYLNCRLLPIINGLPLYHHYTYINNGGFYINKEIKKLLKEQYVRRSVCKGEASCSADACMKDDAVFINEHKREDNHMTYTRIEKLEEGEKKETNIPENLLNYYYNLYPLNEILMVIDNIPDNDIEYMKIKYFYLKNEKTKLHSNKFVLYEFRNYEIIIEPHTRWKACEILFTKDYEQNINSLFSSILHKLNIMNYSVFHNILLVGGCSNIKGILSKIAESFFQALSVKKNAFKKDFENKVNFIFPKIAPNLRQFIGASICSNLENLPDYTEEHIHNNVLYNHLNEDVYLTFKR
ncbi:actin-like protein [Plasmodium gonderi]|uniref:Actin-like protein n=1 Tax=Plasmodium gonderi TaxID=77519 RepID=A0A1Y1J9I7_PLAGO|nr:actin-like protein [Plasmodium gonderi]GAW79166.1 actin-like protein [Plasmodium gonderi]